MERQGFRWRDRGRAVISIRRNVWRLSLAALVTISCGVSPSSDAQSPLGPSPLSTLDPGSPYRTTRAEFAIQLKACLLERGLAVEVDPYDLSLDFTFAGPRDAEIATEAVGDCRAAVDLTRNEPLPPLNEAELQQLFDYRQKQAQCLVDAGLAPSSAPPLQVFIDTGGNWAPDRALLEDGSASPSVVRRCEQVENRPNFLDW